jgi:YesN/AraC family two-component response regulator
MRVLLVEDNRVYREVFKNNLHLHFPSLIIEEAENAEEALPKIPGRMPHLVFTDIRMPGMNGLQVTRKIKTDFPNIRVAILTTYDLPEYRQAAAQYGADHYFVKVALKWDEVIAFVNGLMPPFL